MTTEHMGEHVGQSIAYARMNRVVPPWTEQAQRRQAIVFSLLRDLRDNETGLTLSLPASSRSATIHVRTESNLSC
jgi:hypothetical protein